MNVIRQQLLFFLLPIALLFATGLNAQLINHVQGDLLVQLSENTQPNRLVLRWQQLDGLPTKLKAVRQVSRPAGIWLLHFDHTTVSEVAMLHALQKDPQVLLAQFNHHATMRETIPDDELFPDQWQYQNTGQSGGTPGADLDMALAWDITTGGTTITGDTIVVAVLDDGMDINHEDLQTNRWVNHAEIPGNFVDDDNNGYIDDYLGWNIILENDNISGGNHGTPVAGIIGADGNNGIGVSGVNWQVKVMMIKNNFNTTEANILEAYSYALEQRQRYDASNGAEGAFVVATNASFGVNMGDPANAPIWCSVYDLLGEAGILSCGATTNLNLNVDEFGDLPTNCLSDYLIGVTNVNHNDVKPSNAGYGAQSVDLGAFGDGTYTIENGNAYDDFAGTSAATPHVAGVIGLLYSAPCPNLMILSRSDPAAAALLVKNAILEGVEANASLAGITVTGGRLNAANSMNILLEDCAGCIPLSSLTLSDLIDESVVFTWNTNDSLQSVDFRWRTAGSPDWNTVLNVISPLQLSGLSACTAYEYQFRSNCIEESVDFAGDQTFQTDGCCEAPSMVSFPILNAESAVLSWPSVLAANSYEVRYRESGDTDWLTETVFGTQLALPNLQACTFYEYQIRSLCTGEVADYSTLRNFLTTGCGPCLEADYCAANSFNNEAEYIAQVQVGDVLNNPSERGVQGYQDFSESLVAPALEQGANYSISLSPGFGGQAFSESWLVWIDLNQDGSFTSTDVVFSAGPDTAVAMGMFMIPPDTPTGVTRMRVVMEFLNADTPCPFQLSYGEAEDYCIEIIPTSNCAPPSDYMLESVDTSSATVRWSAIGPAINYFAEYRRDGTQDWEPVEVDEPVIHLQGLASCTTYHLRALSTCSETMSAPSTDFTFTTACMVGTNEPTQNGRWWAVAPNPTREHLSLSWRATGEPKLFSLRLHDTFGQVVLEQQWSASHGKNHQIQLADLPAGIYTVALYEGGQLWGVKRIVKID